MRYILLICLASLLNTPARGDDNACVKSAVLHWTTPDIVAGKTAAEIKRANADRLTDYINEAVEKGARMVVTPEMSLVGYPKDRDFKDKAEAAPFAEPIPTVGEAIDAKVSPMVARFAELAGKKRAFLHIGMLEKAGDTMYNTVVVFSPEGKIVARHRKLNLVQSPPLSNEKGYLSAGTTPTVYDGSSIGLGDVGIAICADIYHQDVVDGKRILPHHLMEAYRRLEKVNTIAVSSAWTVDADPDGGPTNGWTAWRFFRELSMYANSGAYIPSDKRFTGTYPVHPTRKVAVLVANTSSDGPGAGIFHGSDKELASKKNKGDDGVVIACIPTVKVKDGGGNAAPTHAPKK